MLDIFYLAPLRGVTGRVFRNLLAERFASPDLAVAPFIPTFAGARIKPTLLRDIDPAAGQRIPLIPQVIGKDPAQLRTLLKAFKALGYQRADLNAGCPWPFVVKKGRGAGLLADASVLEAMLEVGCDEMPGGFSIKTRLGVGTPDLLAARMELLNSYPLREVTIHPRTARQMYRGAADLDAFAAVLPLCRHPVVYNGDIRSYADWRARKTRFPQVTRWMIGRGLVMNPALMEAIRTGADTPCEPGRLLAFLDVFLKETEKELSGPAPVLGRMKELWRYVRVSFRNGEALWKAVRICRTLDEYRRTVDRAGKDG